MKKALFLDRDGVVNIDHGYVGRVEDFDYVPGIIEFILEGQNRGFLPFVITNQSGIARGYYSLEDFMRLSRWMVEDMRSRGVDIDMDRIFFCPHHPHEACSCRKPEPGMLLEARKKFSIDMSESLMVGDKESDMEAAESAGVGRLYKIESNVTPRWEDIDAIQR
jgi:D-glycero-D-manno-heptose 1,7-bisphosphate phosphatase